MRKKMIVGLIMSIYGGVALAEHATTDTEDNSTLVLGSVNVTAKSVGPLSTTSVLSSVDVLGADRIETQNVMNSWQLLGQMPGVQLTQFKQGVESGKPSFRGFNGEGEINAVKLLIDGIPSNTNDGNMRYMDMIFPLELEAIEVVRGTNDPRYGLHNIAGNINMVTKQGGDYVQARATYGSFNTMEGQFAAGIEKNGFSQNYFVAAQGIDGYREHADSDKYNLAGKWFFTSDDQKVKAGVIARHYRHDADEPGYLTFAQTHEDDEQSMPHNAFDGAEREMEHLSGHFDWNLTDDLSFSAKTYMNHIDDQRWVRFSASQGQQERVTKERHTGYLTSLTWRPQVAFLHKFALEVGYNQEWQDNESERYNTVERVRTSQSRNQQFDFDTKGGYVQAILQPIPSLKFIPAYRFDKIEGNYTNRLTGVEYNINDYGTIDQPKFSAVWTPIAGYSLYGNWGKTFQVGVGTASYKVNQSSDLDPSINEGWETGLKFKPVNWLDGRIAVWEQRASNEARRKLGDPANDSENVGKTKRKGVDFQLNAQLTDNLSAWMSYAWQDSKILKADAASLATQGQEIDHVPHYLYNFGLNFQATPKWRFGLQANGQGDAYLERENIHGKFGRYFIVDASAVYQLNEQISVDLQIRNLTDRYYEYVWWNTTPNPDISMHAPNDGRAGYLSVNFKI